MYTMIAVFVSMITICVTMSMALLVLMVSLSKKAMTDTEKTSPFECGFMSYEESRSPFSIHFFIVGLIFLIFDVELVLLYPYLSSLMEMTQSLSTSVLILFLVILSSGLFIEWEKSYLEWSK